MISAVVTDNCLQLARTLKSAEKKYKNAAKKGTGEMKAAGQLPSTRKRVITRLMKSDFSIYSLIFDLTTIRNTPYKYDDIYAVGMSTLCSCIYSFNPGICFILDKRYTKETLRISLNQNIKELICHNSGVNADKIDIYHGDSIEYAELRAADYIAYETYQKYKNGSDIYDIFADRITRVMFYSNTSWGEIKKESKTPYQ